MISINIFSSLIGKRNPLHSLSISSKCPLLIVAIAGSPRQKPLHNVNGQPLSLTRGQYKITISENIWNILPKTQKRNNIPKAVMRNLLLQLITEISISHELYFYPFKNIFISNNTIDQEMMPLFFLQSCYIG